MLLDNSDMEGEQRVNKDVANNLISAMEPIAGASRNHALAGGRTSAAKSGTAQLLDTGNNKDAWFIGATPSLSTAVWMGTDDNVPLYSGGSGGSMFGASLSFALIGVGHLVAAFVSPPASPLVAALYRSPAVK